MTRWPVPPPLDVVTRPTLDVVDEATCWQLLHQTGIGRVAVVGEDGRVLVVPVNFVVDDRSVLFRTAAGSLLGSVGPTATFQADAFDEVRQVGWSVLVHGDVEVTESPVPWPEPDPKPWPAGRDDRLVRIRATTTTGRVLRPASYESDCRGYL